MKNQELNKLLRGLCEEAFGEDLVDSYGDYEVGDKIYVMDLPDGCYLYGNPPERLKGTIATIAMLDEEDESVFAEFPDYEAGWFSMLEIELVNKKEEE